MTQIKVVVQLSNINPEQMEVRFTPSTNHWGCVDWDELFNQLEVEYVTLNLSKPNQETMNSSSKKLQSIIDQWEATNSLWVKELH